MTENVEIEWILVMIGGPLGDGERLVVRRPCHNCLAPIWVANVMQYHAHQYIRLNPNGLDQNSHGVHHIPIDTDWDPLIVRHITLASNVGNTPLSVK